MSATICLTVVALHCAAEPRSIVSPPVRASTDAEIAAFVQGPGATKAEAELRVLVREDNAVTIVGLRSLNVLVPRGGLNIAVDVDHGRQLTSEEVVAIAETPSVHQISLESQADSVLATLGSSGSRVRCVIVGSNWPDSLTTIDGITCLANLKCLETLHFCLKPFPAAQAWKLGAFRACQTLECISTYVDPPLTQGLIETFDAIRAHLPLVYCFHLRIGEEYLYQVGGPGGKVTLTSKGKNTIVRQADPLKVIARPRRTRTP